MRHMHCSPLLKQKLPPDLRILDVTSPAVIGPDPARRFAGMFVVRP